MLSYDRVGELGVIVVDELHMVGDRERGHLIELLLGKVKASNKNVQLIGMSATYPNITDLCGWLNALYYHTDFRPIKLSEYTCIGPQVYARGETKDTLTFGRKLALPLKDPVAQWDNRAIHHLCNETVNQGGSVLVFVRMKTQCADLAESIAESNSFHANLSAESLVALGDLADKLRVTEPALAQLVMKGVSYHHGGLTKDERLLIEDSFRENHIRVICCTTTLSSGVNLPARRVIIRYGRMLDPRTYQQMIGRAGRQGHTKSGDAYIMFGDGKDEVKGNFECAKKMLEGKLGTITSALAGTEFTSPIMPGDDGARRRARYAQENRVARDQQLQRSVLEAVVGLRRDSEVGIIQVFKDFLLCGRELGEMSLGSLVSGTIQDLVVAGFLGRDTDSDDIIFATKLGEATCASGLKPVNARSSMHDLEKAYNVGIILRSELHLIFLVTPSNYAECEPSWEQYLDAYERLDVTDKNIARLVGVKPMFLAKMQGHADYELTSDADKEDLRLHTRFFHALVLRDLGSGLQIKLLAERFYVDRGKIQQLQRMGAMYAGMISVVCTQLKWQHFGTLFKHFRDRLAFGVQESLVDLMRLPSMTKRIATALVEDRIDNLADLAEANLDTIADICYRIIAFDTTSNDPPRHKAKRTAMKTINEARRALGREDRSFAVDIDGNSIAAFQGETVWGRVRKCVVRHGAGGNTKCFFEEWKDNYLFVLAANIDPNRTTAHITVTWDGHAVWYIKIDDYEEAVEANKAFRAERKKQHPDRRKGKVEPLYTVQEFLKRSNLRPIVFRYMNAARNVFRMLGIWLYGEVRDPSIAAWLVDPGHFVKTFDEIPKGGKGVPCPFKLAKTEFGRAGVPDTLSLMIDHQYCAAAALTWRLERHYQMRLEEIGLSAHYLRVEMSMCKILAATRFPGCTMDLKFADDACDMFVDLVTPLRETIFKLAPGGKFDISNAEEVKRIMYDELKLRSGVTCKARCVKKETLTILGLQHPLPKMISEYRRLIMLQEKQFALKRIIQSSKVDPKKKQQQGDLHLRKVMLKWNPYTSTGRTFMKDPGILYLGLISAISLTRFPAVCRPTRIACRVPLTPPVCPD